MSRIDNIKNFKIAQEAAAEMEKLSTETKIKMLKAVISTYTDRMKELLEVGIACQENDIPLQGHSWGGHEGYDTHQFLSNGWSHLVGFVPWYEWNREEALRHPQNERHNIKGFGKIGGGADNYNLLIGFNDDGSLFIKSTGDEIYALTRFIENFDTFEKEFYAYVDKVTGAI